MREFHPTMIYLGCYSRIVPWKQVSPNSELTQMGKLKDFTNYLKSKCATALNSIWNNPALGPQRGEID